MIHDSDIEIGGARTDGPRVASATGSGTSNGDPLSLRLLRPGGVDGMRTFVVAVAAMLAILIVDLATVDTIRLQVLYVFPLAAIGLHTDRRWALLTGLGVAITCQCATIATMDGALSARVAAGMIAIGASLLVARLAGALRAHHLVVKQSAATDALTGLLNRRTFDEILALEIAVLRRQGGTLGIVLVDLDGFKALNDSAGHRAGDDALRLTASTLRACTRGSDAVSRIGGDEFAILIRGASSEGCGNLCRKIVGGLAVAMRQRGVVVTASVGGKVFAAAPASVAEAVEAADQAMYEAKARGKCTWVCR